MTDPTDGRTRPFADVLGELDRGRVHTELSDQLQDLITRVMETGKAGSLTLSISVKPMPKAEGQVIVSNKIGVKRPEADRKDAIFFVDDDNNLTRHDPYQQSLPLSLRDVSDPARTDMKDAQ